MNRKIIIQSGIALSLSFASAHGAGYSTDFESFVEGDMNGQGGWSTTEATPEASYVLAAEGVFGTKAATIGYVTPVSSPEVYVKTSFPSGISMSGAIFSVDFQIADSTNAQAARDAFGFRLADASGSSLFDFHLNPFAQSANPDGTVGKWFFSYSTGGGPMTNFYANEQQTLIYSAEESAVYQMTIAFQDLGLNGDVDFQLMFDNVVLGSGTLPGLGSSTINQVGSFWRPTQGPSAPGDNYLAFDNVEVIPEPGFVGLFGVGLVGFFLRRRR